MTGTTISGAYTVSVTLSSPSSQNPATVAASGSINVSGTTGSGIYGISATSWSLYNHGVVIGPARGVFLTAGGTITNFASAVISGGARGIDITGAAGTVTNSGSIAGTSQQGIRLAAGGSVTNLSSGTIDGGTSYVAVAILQGGMVTNAAGGTIGNGIAIAGGVGTVDNNGLINNSPLLLGFPFDSISLAVGGTVANGGSISNAVYFGGVGTLTNTGSIAGSQSGVTLKAGGIVSNASTGLIVASSNDDIYLHGGTVINAGSIGATDYHQFQYPSIGVYDNGASVVITNQAGGLIAGSSDYTILVRN